MLGRNQLEHRIPEVLEALVVGVAALRMLIVV